MRAFALNAFANFDNKGRQPFVRDVFARVDGSEDFAHGFLDFCSDVPPSSVEQPPAEGQKFAIVFKVVAARALDPLILLVF